MRYVERRSLKYYHYGCDGFDDVGWGCGYRTLQTMCSWIRAQMLEENKKRLMEKTVRPVPTILEIQQILHECGDKPLRFVGSKDWIGCFEACLVIDCLYDVPCKIVHCDPGSVLNRQNELISHFQKFGSPGMMGGDLDNASKCVLGVGLDQTNDASLLIADPHLYSKQTISKQFLVENDWLKWSKLSYFDNFDSFYNFCLPQKKSSY